MPSEQEPTQTNAYASGPLDYVGRRLSDAASRARYTLHMDRHLKRIIRGGDGVSAKAAAIAMYQFVVAKKRLDEIAHVLLMNDVPADGTV